MFNKPEDEALFLKNITTYQQEFGKDKVVLLFPEKWAKTLDPKNYLPMKIESWELNGIGIRASNCSANWTLLLT